MPTLEEQGYQLLTTDQMLELLASGHTLTLPRVDVQDESIREHYAEDELAHLGLKGDMNDIVSIEYVGEKPVMCIAVDDPEHVYLTDGFIPTHNTSNIVFLKSTDDSMLDTLQKMSGTRHVTYKDSKTVTRNLENLIHQNEGTVSFNIATVEEPVISYNDMAFIPERNSIVFRAGDSPIWNRDMTILPMSWRLFKTTIVQPGTDYSLQTIPTTSTAREFDVRKNMPDFDKMLRKRMAQAGVAKEAMKLYQEAYKYSDYEISTLDPDIYANEVMDIINDMLTPAPKNQEGVSDEERNAILAAQADAMGYMDNYDDCEYDELPGEVEENTDVTDEVARIEAEEQERLRKIYAGNILCKSELVNMGGQASHRFDIQIQDAYKRCKSRMWRDYNHFVLKNDGLYDSEGNVLYIKHIRESDAMAYINQQIEEPESRVFSESEIEDAKELGSYQITDDFYRFLASLEAWDFAEGSFDREMHKQLSSMYDE